MKQILMLLSCVVFMWFPMEVCASQWEENPADSPAAAADDYDFSDIQDFLNSLKLDNGWNLSFRELLAALMNGEILKVVQQAAGGIRSMLFAEIHRSGQMLLQVVVLGMIGAVFTNFSSIFSSSHISETGFFITYLLLFTFLATSFLASAEIARDILEQCMSFMRVLLPAFFLAVAFAGGSMSALVMYEGTLMGIAAVQWVFLYLLVPMTQVYTLLVLASHIQQEDLLSRATGLLSNMIGWAVKTLFGLILGLHLIQGMVLPYVDSVKTASVQRIVQIIPGVGAGASAVTQTVIGSGVLIKNTIGAAAVVILVVLSVIPVMKLSVLMVAYQAVAALLQPVCDKRLISCIEAVGTGHHLLLRLVCSAILLFIITIAIVCGATNSIYYAV